MTGAVHAPRGRRRARRPRGDGGFTLIELLVAMPIGLIVIMVALDLSTHAWGLNSTVNARQDALQRGRMAMELVTRQLRATVCLTTVTPARAIVAGSDASVTFFADLGDGSVPPQQRTLTLDAQAGTIVQAETDGAGTPPVFAGAPTRTVELMRGAAPVTGVPVLRYYAYVNGVLSATPLRTPLSAADAARTAYVSVTFTSTARGAGAASADGTTFNNDVFTRTVDPMNAKAGQACV
jgi:prepilin-type N-terminal cleavage/methylation domain-containing protein